MREKNTLFPAAVILLVLGSSVFAYQQVIDLGISVGYQCSRAQSINDNGQIVGYACNENSYGLVTSQRTCLFDSSGGGDNTNLGTLGGFAKHRLFNQQQRQDCRPGPERNLFFGFLRLLV